MPNLHPFYTVLLLIFTSFTFPVNAAQFFQTNSLHVENRSPFIQHYALAIPSLHRSLNQDEARFSSHFEVANYLSRTSDNFEQLFIDGESWIWTNQIQFPIYSNTMLSISLPWVRHSKGQTDHFIYTFHDVLKLPQNGRDKRADNQFIWQLQNESGLLFNMDNAQSDLGDLRFNLSLDDPDNQTQINAHIELPTGRFDNQSGNDKLDVGISWLHYNPEWLTSRDWLEEVPLSLWYGAGIAYVSHHKILAQFSPNNWIMSARLGVAWKISSQWQFKSQLDSHSPLFETNIRELGWIPLLATLGFEYTANNTFGLTLSLSEDLRPRVTPDAIFTIGTSFKF